MLFRKFDQPSPETNKPIDENNLEKKPWHQRFKNWVQNNQELFCLILLVFFMPFFIGAFELFILSAATLPFLDVPECFDVAIPEHYLYAMTVVGYVAISFYICDYLFGFASCLVALVKKYIKRK